MAHNTIFRWLAILWTLLIAVLCLVRFDELPKIGMEVNNVDKYIHFIFHFVFTVLWFLVLKDHNEKKRGLLFTIFATSLLYGIAIEIAQGVFTTTRTADLSDVIANVCGSATAIGILALSRRFKN